jgi:NAD(P)H dehydrogenase (quinone)
MLKPRILVRGATGKMAQAIGQVVLMPCWLFMKAARMGRLPIDLISGVRYCIDDHKCGAFELGAPAADALDVTGQPAEDFETIERRYASLAPNRWTVGNCVRQFVQSVIALLSPGVDLDRHYRELRRPFPSEPQFAAESKVWLSEHAVAHTERGIVIAERRTLGAQVLKVNRGCSNQRRDSCCRNSVFS